MIRDRADMMAALRSLKARYLEEGFLIEGVFGSYARGDYHEASDVDILYRLNETFLQRYQGFCGFKRLYEIKQELTKSLGKSVDLAPANNLSDTGEKYILKELVRV